MEILNMKKNMQIYIEIGDTGQDADGVVEDIGIVKVELENAFGYTHFYVQMEGSDPGFFTGCRVYGEKKIQA
jgi:hypothetical protein